MAQSLDWKKATDFYDQKGEAQNFAKIGRGDVLLGKGDAETPRTDQTLQGPLLMTSPLSFGVVSIKISRGVAQPLGSVLTGTAA